MRKHLVSGLMLLAGLTAASSAPADEFSGFRGGFGGGQLGYSLNATATSPKFDEKSPAFQAMFGYALNQYFAGELQYDHIGSQSSAALGNLKLKSDAALASAVGTWPFFERYGAYGRLGFARWSLSPQGGDSKTGTSFAYGAGVQTVFDKSLIRLEYDRWKADELDATSINLNFVWTF
jgi:opacity protein-like surface antigen